MWSDLNQPPLGVGYTPTIVAACIAAPTAASCAPSSAVEKAARPYNNTFPYLNYVSQASLLGWSSYNGLQVTANMRASHGLTFISGYTYSHALDTGSNLNPNSVAIGPNVKNYALSYGNSDNDIRNRFTFAPTYAFPGIKTPGQMLQGWTVSSIISLQQGAPWSAWDPTSVDWLGTGENGDQANSLVGAQQFWNYSGPASAFQGDSKGTPCFGNLPGCTSYAAAGGIPAACSSAATAPYAGNAQLQSLAAAALTAAT
jgi:hypothetical protein